MKTFPRDFVIGAIIVACEFSHVARATVLSYVVPKKKKKKKKKTNVTRHFKQIPLKTFRLD